MKKSRLSPTLLFLLTFIVGMILIYLFPWHITQYLDDTIVRVLGLVFLCICFIFNFLAYRKFRSHATPYDPFSKPIVLLDNGIFALSRNPVYLALVLSQIGLGFIFDTVWLIVMSIILMVALHYLVIINEERVLEIEFQERYEDYKNRTRRWF